LTRVVTRVGGVQGALVVGGGFIGSHVARGFVTRGVPTTVLSRRPPDAPTAARMNGATLVMADAGDGDALRRALDRADHVVWCVGGLLPAESNDRKVEDVISGLPPLLVMLDILAARDDTSLTLMSSGGTIYGNPTVLPVPEQCQPRPITSHGVTKVASELYLSLYRELHGVRTLALRCGNVFGAGQQPNRSQGVVATALARVARGEPVPVFGDGSAVRDYIHVDDVVEVVCALAARTDTPPVVNVGTGSGTSVRELLSVVEAVTDRRVRTEPLGSRGGDVRSVVLDVTLLRSLMDFRPLGLADGIARTWEALCHARLVASR